MSNDHERERARGSQHGDRAGGHDHDEEAHDTGAARRASTAKLREERRRVAEAPGQGKADGKAGDAKKKEQASDQAAYEAMYANILLLAKRLKDSAADIMTIIEGPGDEGGTDKKLEAIKATYTAIRGQAMSLRIDAATVRLDPSRKVDRDLQILHGAFLEFERAMTRADHLKGPDSLGHKFRPRWVWEQLEFLHEHFGLSMKELAPRTNDERLEVSTEKLEGQAMRASLHSIMSAVAAVRAAQSSGTERQLDEAVGELIGAVGLSRSWLKNMSPDRIGTTDTLADAVAAVEAVQRSLTTQPGIATRLTESGFSYSVDYLKSRVKGRK